MLPGLETPTGSANAASDGNGSSAVERLSSHSLLPQRMQRGLPGSIGVKVAILKAAAHQDMTPRAARPDQPNSRKPVILPARNSASARPSMLSAGSSR